MPTQLWKKRNLSTSKPTAKDATSSSCQTTSETSSRSLRFPSRIPSDRDSKHSVYEWPDCLFVLAALDDSYEGFDNKRV